MKKLLIGCGALGALLLLAAVIAIVVLPSEYEVEHVQRLDAPQEAVYAEMVDLHSWPEWSAWSQAKDPDCVWSYNDVEGVGSRTDWDGPAHGKGYMLLTDSAPGTRIAFDIGFISGEDAQVAQSVIELSPAGEGTNVRWTMSGELSGAEKLMGPFMNAVVGAMYQEGLTNLDERLSADG